MAKLIYSAIASADGYVEDAAGRFDWGAPGEELFGFINDLERSVGTYRYGRRMYETMLYWETAHTVPGQPSVARDFTGIWQAAEKIVFSKTLQSVPGARTRIERNLDPGMVRQLKSAAGHDITVGVRTWPGRPSRPARMEPLRLRRIAAEGLRLNPGKLRHTKVSSRPGGARVGPPLACVSAPPPSLAAMAAQRADHADLDSLAAPSGARQPPISAGRRSSFGSKGDCAAPGMMPAFRANCGTRYVRRVAQRGSGPAILRQGCTRRLRALA
jgi:hypothetical protein